MPLVTPKQIYDGLPKDKPCAVGAFNVHNMEYTQGVIQAAEELQAPVILMLGEPMIKWAGLDMLTTIALKAADMASVPVAVTLDHGKSREMILGCIERGVSIMADCSHYSYEENVALTAEYAEAAHKKGLSIEAELGSVGGAEDDDIDNPEKMTDPSLAHDFVTKTGVDALAIAIGNCHGLYKKPPVLDIERLKTIKGLIDIPLVLHGGSDIPVDQSQKAIEEGIRKFNIGTDLKYAFSRAMKEILAKDPMPFNPPANLGFARNAVAEVTKQKIELFGSTGFAKYYK